MSIFAENTLAFFKNVFNEEISQEGDCRVASSGIMFSSRINLVNSTRIIKYSSDDQKTNSVVFHLVLSRKHTKGGQS